MKFSGWWPVFGLLALLVVIFAWSLHRDNERLPSALVGSPLPTWSAPRLLSSDSVQLRQWNGPALVNLWATWCPSCREEHAFLMKLAGQGVIIYGINYKDQSPKARQWLAQLGNPYQSVAVDSDGDLGIELGVYGAPETFLLDQQGNIILRHAGPLNADVWRQLFADYWPGVIING